MEFALSSSPRSLPSLRLPRSTPKLASPFAVGFSDRRVRRPVLVSARAGFSRCEPIRSSSLNLPLELRSPTGKFLSGVLLNQKSLFEVVVAEELKLLADHRNDAVNRMALSSRSDEACLHRRIAQLKEQECQVAVEDVMHMLILHKFSKIGVPLVPKLSRCTYNSRLEIGPSRDWELESIHSPEVLQMVREHVSAVIGLKMNSSVTESWATTEIQTLQISRLYQNSIMYGYFLKSASHRLFLEQCLSESHQNAHSGLVFNHLSNTQSVPKGRGSTKLGLDSEKLKCYMMSFDAAALQNCAKLRSREAVDLTERHMRALFGNASEDDEVILTSFSSLKRLILEAVAFGSFLWEKEEYVNSVFKLSENK